ncbi:hypothetical protein VTJ04DRAFT_9226 [Mycothermus thermophilus]|uniref:uncharacterized protein n=1 Tax=Humicola insolens TaxID=85995 RepID=UPI003742CC8F
MTNTEIASEPVRRAIYSNQFLGAVVPGNRIDALLAAAPELGLNRDEHAKPLLLVLRTAQGSVWVGCNRMRQEQKATKFPSDDLASPFFPSPASSSPRPLRLDIHGHFRGVSLSFRGITAVWVSNCIFEHHGFFFFGFELLTVSTRSFTPVSPLGTRHRHSSSVFLQLGLIP